MSKKFDCVVCGSCTVDILVKPIDLEQPIGADRLFSVEPIVAATGGIVCNSGTVFSRMGLRTAVFTYVGHDEWGRVVRSQLHNNGIETEFLLEHPDMPTSTTVVMIDSSGQRSFAHCQGAPKRLNRDVFMSRMSFFAECRAMLLGYFSLLPELEGDLPDVLDAVQKAGCLTALDTAGDGGSLNRLTPALPFLDFYVPSLGEAMKQTGLNHPQDILALYRKCGMRGVLGIKLGAKGALLSGVDGELIEVATVKPPGPIIDSTGAGDAFFAGLLTGVLKEMSLAEAGKFAAACGACCVTGLGATAGMRGIEETKKLAGLS